MLALIVINIKGLTLGTNNQANGVAMQSDGKIVIGGTSFVNGQNQFLVARYSSAGIIDSTYGTSGATTSSIGTYAMINAVAVQSDNKMIVAGGAIISGSTNAVIARYTTTGILDATFGTSGITSLLAGGEGATINSVAIQSDGKIVAAGTVIISAVPYFLLMRFNTNGTLDTTFNTTGIVQLLIGLRSGATSVAIQTDGKILIGGSSDTGYVVARYGTTGTIDATFGTSGIATIALGSNQSLNTLRLQSTGKIVVAGVVGTSLSMSRFNTDGSLDTAFGTSGTTTLTLGSYQYATSIAIQSDDKIIVVGSADSQVLVARYSAAGALDTSFATSGVVIFAPQLAAAAQSVVLQSDQKIVMAGLSCDNALLSRFATGGSFDATFGSAGITLEPQGLFVCMATSTGSSGGVTNGNYLYAYDTTTQSVSNANTWQNVTFNTITSQTNGWTYSVPNFLCAQTGLYMIQYNLLMRNNGGPDDSTGSARIVKNGIEIPGSSMTVDLRKESGDPVAGECSWSVLANINSGDTITLQITANVSGQKVQIYNAASPATTKPTITVVITRIG